MFTINLTFIGQIIGFVLFVWACMAWIWPPIMEAIEGRQKQIQDAIRQAREAEQNVQTLQDKYKKTLSEAQMQAKGILDNAKKVADQSIDEAKVQAQVQADKIIVAAHEKITQDRERLKLSMQDDVELLVQETLLRLLGKTPLDKQIDQDFIMEKIKQL